MFELLKMEIQLLKAGLRALLKALAYALAAAHRLASKGAQPPGSGLEEAREIAPDREEPILGAPPAPRLEPRPARPSPLRESYSPLRQRERVGREVSFAAPWRSGGKIAMRASAARIARKASRKAGETAVVGVLLWRGQRRKTRADGSSYSCYCADVETDEGAVVELVGADLERAIAASGAEIGDRVRVEKVGRLPVDLGQGRRAQKNLWNVHMEKDRWRQ